MIVVHNPHLKCFKEGRESDWMVWLLDESACTCSENHAIYNIVETERKGMYPKTGWSKVVRGDWRLRKKTSLDDAEINMGCG